MTPRMVGGPDGVVVNDCGKVFGRCRRFHQGTGIPRMSENGPVRKECGVRDENNIGVRLTELDEVRNRQGAALGQNQIQHNHVEPSSLHHLQGIFGRTHTGHMHVKPLKMPLPDSPQVIIPLDNQSLHHSHPSGTHKTC